MRPAAPAAALDRGPARSGLGGRHGRAARRGRPCRQGVRRPPACGQTCRPSRPASGPRTARRRCREPPRPCPVCRGGAWPRAARAFRRPAPRPRSAARPPRRAAIGGDRTRWATCPAVVPGRGSRRAWRHEPSFGAAGGWCAASRRSSRAPRGSPPPRRRHQWRTRPSRPRGTAGARPAETRPHPRSMPDHRATRRPGRRRRSCRHPPRRRRSRATPSIRRPLPPVLLHRADRGRRRHRRDVPRCRRRRGPQPPPR